MTEQPDDPSFSRSGSERFASEEAPPSRSSRFELIWQQLTNLGLADAALRLGTHTLSILAVILVVWGASQFYQIARPLVSERSSLGAQAAEIPTPTSTPLPPEPQPLPSEPVYSRPGVLRKIVMHTTIPQRGREELSTYTVQPGDTVFKIAEMFNLQPETILWGNYAILADDPHRLKAGQELTILPVNGTYYEWQAGDGLNGVARFFGVTPETIINWRGNGLEPDTIGDYASPNIDPGTWLVIPGGSREFVTWSAPRITRADPSVAKVLGPGNCGQISDGPVGIGAFVWPANNHFLSGYDYAPAANHYGIDIDGNEGDAIYAVDNGVVVYAGWNNWGYGNMIVIDHGNGWQSLYAHLSSLNVSCGSFAYQGGVIGAFGSTGNSSGAHLHFELMSDLYGKVNPWNFLP
jgi:hypothetical protein